VTFSKRRLAPGEIDHELVWSSVAAVSLFAFAAWARLHDAPTLPCVFHLVTGLPCVTCGGTRALMSLLAGEPLAALRWNPLVSLAALCSAAYVLYAVTVVAARLPRVTAHAGPMERRAARMATVATITLNWAFLLVNGR
jgi:hypothetical protein